jgi:hypothetical protein
VDEFIVAAMQALVVLQAAAEQLFDMLNEIQDWVEG